MRLSVLSPPFPGFDLEADDKVPVSYLNIYSNSILDDWSIICKVHQIEFNSRLERFDVSYNNDGSVRDLHCKIIAKKETGFDHYWLQLLSSRKIYLTASSEVGSCSYYDDLIMAQDFFLLWSNINLGDMKPNGDFEWYEFSFYGEKVPYAMEDTKKFFLNDRGFVPLGNDSLPVTGYFISSYGMARKGSVEGMTFEGQGYQDYFFGVGES